MAPKHVNDAAVISDWLEQLPEDEPLESLMGMVLADMQPVHEAVRAQEVTSAIPPRKNPRIRKGNVFTHRNEVIAGCRRLVRSIWKR